MASKSNFSSPQVAQSLGIIIPMFNEAMHAKACAQRVLTAMQSLSLKTHLIIINDGSTDETADILATLQQVYPKDLTVLTHTKNGGFGAATQTGIKYALKQHYTWILHMDSDLTNDPKYIKDFINASGKHVDCIKASRYIKGAKVLKVPLFRRVISQVGNVIASRLFGMGITDCTNGFRMVRCEKIKGYKFKQKNFSIILEELYLLKKRKAVCREIPYTLTARKKSLSHFSYKPIIFVEYVKYAFLSLFTF